MRAASRRALTNSVTTVKVDVVAYMVNGFVSLEKLVTSVRHSANH